jgi:invasion protein IalB
MRDLCKRALFASVLLAFAPGAADAKPSSESYVYGDWIVECHELDGNRSCVMSQRIIDARSQIQLLQLSVIRNLRANATTLQALVPLGAWLEPGIAVKVGTEAKALELTYAKCVPSGCIADQSVTSSFLGAMKSAERGVLMVADRNRKVVSVPFSLRGFGEALDALDAKSNPDGWLQRLKQLLP